MKITLTLDRDKINKTVRKRMPRPSIKFGNRQKQLDKRRCRDKIQP